MAFFDDPYIYEAKPFGNTKKGVGKNEDTCIEILFTRKNLYLKNYKDCLYKSLWL